MPSKPFPGREEALPSTAASPPLPYKADRVRFQARSRSMTNLYTGTVPDHRINAGTGIAMVEDKEGVVMSEHAIRRLPISRQIVDKVAYYDPHELLEAVRAKFKAAPVIMTGLKPAPPTPLPRPRAIKAPRSRARSGAPT